LNARDNGYERQLSILKDLRENLVRAFSQAGDAFADANVVHDSSHLLGHPMGRLARAEILMSGDAYVHIFPVLARCQ
jgi:hypothetical protein